MALKAPKSRHTSPLSDGTASTVATSGEPVVIPETTTGTTTTASPVEAEVTEKPDADAWVGRTLGNYELLARIGEGGMGVVYRARHKHIGREVAVKLLLEEHARNRGRVARFFQEARVVNMIRHRNIVDVTDFVELDDGTVFIVMELLSGRSLRRRYDEQGPLPAREVTEIGIAVCDALAAAHEAGVIHRDLKPDNIFLSGRLGATDGVKLLDFGIAKLLVESGEPPSLRTREGAIVGTPAYMSPAQAVGEPATPQSDIYSLGAVMYEMITGQRAVRAANMAEYARKQATGTVPPLSDTEAGAHASQALDDIIHRCLAFEPSDRPSSAAALARELRATLTSPAPRDIETTPNRWPAILGGMGLVVAVVIAIMLGRGSGNSDHPRDQPAPTATRPAPTTTTPTARSAPAPSPPPEPAAAAAAAAPQDAGVADKVVPNPFTKRPAIKRPARPHTKRAAPPRTAKSTTTPRPAPSAPPETAPSPPQPTPAKSGPLRPAETVNPFEAKP